MIERKILSEFRPRTLLVGVEMPTLLMPLSTWTKGSSPASLQAIFAFMPRGILCTGYFNACPAPVRRSSGSEMACEPHTALAECDKSVVALRHPTRYGREFAHITAPFKGQWDCLSVAAIGCAVLATGMNLLAIVARSTALRRKQSMPSTRRCWSHATSSSEHAESCPSTRNYFCRCGF